MAIYDRANNEFVVGNVNGEIQTLYKPRLDYVDSLVEDGKAIKVEG